MAESFHYPAFLMAEGKGAAERSSRYRPSPITNQLYMMLLWASLC